MRKFNAIWMAVLMVSVLCGCSAADGGPENGEMVPEFSSVIPLETGDNGSSRDDALEETSGGSSAVAGGNGEADEVMAAFGAMGEEYTLHSRSYQQGEVKAEEAPSLGWDGDLILTVKSAQVQEYAPADEDEEDPIRGMWPAYARAFSEPRILKLDMTLTNKDAENKNGVRYLFNAGMFRLAAYEDLLPDNWKDAEGYVSIGERYSVLESQFDKHSDNDDYWAFTLEPGETLEFTLQFLIDRAYLEQKSPFLAVSFGRRIQCGVLLDKIQ